MIAKKFNNIHDTFKIAKTFNNIHDTIKIAKKINNAVWYFQAKELKESELN